MNPRKIKTLVIEDEIYDRKLIEKILATNYNEYIELINSAGTVEEAVIAIRQNKPDLLFLDIELNGNRNGAFDILEQVEQNFKIIFVTAKYEQNDLWKAIKLSCIDYLIKPTKISDFETPVKKVFDELNNSREENSQKIEILKHNIETRNIQEAKISLQEGYTYKPTFIKNIIRCEAQGNYTLFFFTDNTSKLINGNLKSFEDRLSDYGFARISKSDLINLSHIKSFSRKNLSWEVQMTDNKTLYISVQRKQDFQQQYNSLHLS
jgi:two-component system, LytTR family, response regulator